MLDLLIEPLAGTAPIRPADGVPDQALLDLVAVLAVERVSGDPDAAPGLAAQAQGTPFAPVVADAIARARAGARCRVVSRLCLANQRDVFDVDRVIGPFADDELELLEFAVAVVPDRIVVELHGAAPRPRLIVIPATEFPQPAAGRVHVRAGSVWLSADHFGGDPFAFVGVRVSGGVLEFEQIDAAGGSLWRMTLKDAPSVLELASIGWTQDGGDPLEISLPGRLEVDREGPARFDGSLAISAFGNAVGGPCGVAVWDQVALAVPVGIGGASWHFPAGEWVDGAGQVERGSWILPAFAERADSTGNPVQDLGNRVALASRLPAACAGEVELGLVDGLFRTGAPGSGVEFLSSAGTLAIGKAAMRWAPASPAARGELRLRHWAGAGTAVAFALAPLIVGHVRRPGAGRMLEIAGGRIRTQWDRPVDAIGRAFGMAGTGGVARLFGEAGGKGRATLSASGSDGAQERAICVDNAYLSVRGPGSLRLLGSGPAEAPATSGEVRLAFELVAAEPMFPDPYAASWRLAAERGRFPDPGRAAGGETLAVALSWPEGPDAVSVSVDGAVSWSVANQDSDRAGERAHGGRPGREGLALLDLSTRADLFGVEFGADRGEARLVRNRVSVPLARTGLLMQPQVAWEPVLLRENAAAAIPDDVVLEPAREGNATLVATARRGWVEALPRTVGRAIAAAAHEDRPVTARFAMPFGIEAEARFNAGGDLVLEEGRGAVRLERARFGLLDGASRLRLEARHPIRTDASIPGVIHLPHNVVATAGHSRFLPDLLADGLDGMRRIPARRLDLSGYGLSMFSGWQRPSTGTGDPPGVARVRFEVLTGRTSYQVVEYRAYLVPPGCRLVRTLVFDRRNPGGVVAADSGWIAIEDGLFERPAGFHKGLVVAQRDIANIRIQQGGRFTAGPETWERVLYDTTVELRGGTHLQARDQEGFVLVKPDGRDAQQGAQAGLTPEVLERLFGHLGRPMRSPLHGRVAVTPALGIAAGAIVVDTANEPGGTLRFVIGVDGTPELPTQLDWAFVRRGPDGAPGGTPGGSAPLVGLSGGGGFRWTEPGRAFEAMATHALMTSTKAGRVLFREPRIEDPARDEIRAARPLVADPLALARSPGALPAVAEMLEMEEEARIAVAAVGDWRLDLESYATPPAAKAMDLGGWTLRRDWAAPAAKIALGGAGWALERSGEKDELVVSLPWFPGEPDVLRIRTLFEEGLDRPAKLAKAEFAFLGALKPLADILDVLNNLPHDTGGDLPISVRLRQGPGAGFTLSIRLTLAIPHARNERVDVGLGKFSGQFVLAAEMAMAADGADASLSVELSGDMQQAILPPLLYGGGAFRFAIHAGKGKPRIELGFGTVGSLGGDLIPGLVSLEATVSYLYLLEPEKLRPGVKLGMQARAKLLSGLVGLSFGASLMGRVDALEYEEPKDAAIRIFAQLNVVATLEVAWGLVEEEIELEAEFEQRIPLRLVAALAGAINPLGYAALEAL